MHCPGIGKESAHAVQTILARVCQPHPGYLRATKSPGRALVQSLRDLGVVTPVLLAAKGGELVIIDGHRRVAACKRLGIPVPFKLTPYTDDLLAHNR